MYVKYVENAKFVSPSTLPGINFTRHSLAEIYLLNTDLSYRHAFLYIRQLAIHLRNATTLKKKACHTSYHLDNTDSFSIISS